MLSKEDIAYRCITIAKELVNLTKHRRALHNKMRDLTSQRGKLAPFNMDKFVEKRTV